MNKDIIILGGGLTGLSAAYHGGGFIYEKEGAVGGTCASPKADGFIFDLGIHVLHTKDKYVLDLLINKLNCKIHIIKRSAWIYSSGVMTKYPFQVNTFGLPAGVKKDCIDGFRDACGKMDRRKKYRDYEEWVYGKFGKGIAEHFYLPYSEKFWTVPAKEMTMDWVDVRVPLPKLEDVIEGSSRLYEKEYGPNATFRYPLNAGISKIPEAFLPKISNRVFLNKKAVCLSLKNKVITFEDGPIAGYKSLIATIPVPELFRIIKDNVPSKVIDAVRGLRCNSILCVNLGVGKSSIHKSHWIYYPEKDYSFFRISFPKNFCNNLAPSNKSSITAEIAYSGRINKQDMTNKVVKDLIRAKILKKKGEIELIDVRDVKYGYPIYDHNRNANMKIISSYLKRFDVFLAGRYGKWEYQWMHDAVLDGKRVAKEVRQR
ncbi:MAG: FAD-dependent oxidoreductase [Candidatus Omnitrophota bacterium]|nr:FAD-dependent oxidoreductase [Candidatus Omnitrophota bacterium]